MGQSFWLIAEATVRDKYEAARKALGVPEAFDVPPGLRANTVNAAVTAAIEEHADVLRAFIPSSKWRKMNAEVCLAGGPKTKGFCYIGAEAAYHLLNAGRVEKLYSPRVAGYDGKTGRETHWWVVRNKDQHIIDPTRSQYEPDNPPYHMVRKGGGFLTKDPSYGARLVMYLALQWLQRKRR